MTETTYFERVTEDGLTEYRYRIVYRKPGKKEPRAWEEWSKDPDQAVQAFRSYFPDIKSHPIVAFHGRVRRGSPEQT